MDSIQNITSFGADAILVLPTSNKSGRPSKSEELQIRRALYPFFGKISARKAAEKTGINIKTVCSYYKNFQKELLENESKEFMQRCKEEKELGITRYANLIDACYDDLNEVEQEIKAAKAVGNLALVEKYRRLKLKISEQIAYLNSTTINLINTPTADDIFKLSQGDKNEN